MMHYSIVHSRQIETDDGLKWIVFEEPAWYRGDKEDVRDVVSTYQSIGLTVYTFDKIAADGSLMAVLHSPDLGWRIVITRD